MRRIIAQARKELTQMFRDRLTVALALLLPLILGDFEDAIACSWSCARRTARAGVG